MSSSNRDRGPPTVLRPQVLAGVAPAPAFAAAPDPTSNWLDRTQRARARHAAITQNLYTWANYKNWADRMRSTLDDEKK